MKRSQRKIKAKDNVMEVVELFAGIGGFRKACEDLNLKTVWANDIDEKACSVYEAKFGQGSIIRGDIRELKAKIPSHDLLTAGFPCQPFSSAGKKEGIRDARGTLFQEIVSVVSEKKPRFFVLENVKRLLTMERGLHFATILDALCSLGYQLEWRLLSATNLGLPQSRERIFIVGRREKTDLRFALLASEDIKSIPQETRSDIILKKFMNINKHCKKFATWGIAYEGKFIDHDVQAFSDAYPRWYLKDVLQNEEEVGPSFYYDNTVERLEKSVKVDRYVNGVEIIYNQGGGARMGYTVFGVNGIAPTLTASTSRHYERYMIGDKFRRLTNVEYARIQGFEDNHADAVSVYDQYALYGNAVPPPMAKWVIERVVNSVFVEFKDCDYQNEKI